MEFASGLVDFILHIDVHLVTITSAYGVWAYVILFLIVFAETGLVVTPFLPGDSLLFAAGAICSLGTLDVTLLGGLLIVAAIIGDGVNYAIGARVGPRVFNRPSSRLLNVEHLKRAHTFYEKHGGKTIVLARFMPIVRTFAPFVAGIGKMTYRQFLVYNVVGAIIWVVSFLALGYFFGNQPIVKKNFTLVIAAIIVLSAIPAVLEMFRARKEL
ncbi:MAG: DedA family protein [Candidatus Kapabacteria bacterium]|nr:DedA family protein [Candidatus Kapabacteria bacterium]